MKQKIEAQLLEWKNKDKGRMPLLISGAPQVGMTYILREFGERNCQNVVYINLETNLSAASFFDENIAPEKILRYLETAANQKITPAKRYSYSTESSRASAP